MKNKSVFQLNGRDLISIAFNKLVLAHCFDKLSDESFLKLAYRVHMGRRLNLTNPQRLTEKIQWIKLYDRNPLYVTLSDKASVKEWVNNRIGSNICIPTLGIWDSFSDIDFSALPDSFVLKCTHDSGSIVIIRDKSQITREQLEKHFARSLGKNMFYWGREFVYKSIHPRIIAEPYMEDSVYNELRDYKFFCFHGRPRIMFVASERFNEETETRFDFFDMDFNHLKLLNGHPNADTPPAKPRSFELMKQYASVLSEDIPFVRVDYYEINGQLYFGEMTFYHNCGFVGFEPDSWDYEMGSWLSL